MHSRKAKQFEFTVIAGSLKGRRIHAPDLGITRPPLTRLRKAIFDFLMPYIRDAKYLDLFSGTGSYLFEALSRGATDCTGVEMEPRMADAINEQAQRLEVADRLHCRTDDVFRIIPELAQAGHLFDVIMAAPPQYQGMLDRTLELFANNPLLAPDGLLLCQHDSSEVIRYNQDILELVQARRYGNTTFTILTGKQST